MKWVWPFSWYYRCRDLEAQVVTLKTENQRLDALYRASAITQTGLTAAYLASINSISSEYLRLQSQRAKAAADAQHERFLKSMIERNAESGDA